MGSEEPMPPSPLTALAEGAAQLHELYTAYVAAGFTPAQAMQLVCAMVGGAAGQRG